MADEDISVIELTIQSGTVIANRYEVQDLIGTGVTGSVFRVNDRHLGGDVVALKVLHPYLQEDKVMFGRFQNEVRIARSLAHPNIVRIHDMGLTDEGFTYISMELVDGQSVRSRITANQNERKEGQLPIPFEEAIDILVQTLNGVEYAHQQGVVHRDLKPANIMMTKEGKVKLADFGTARIAGASTSLTRTGQIVGTPDYIANSKIAQRYYLGEDFSYK